MPIKNFLNKINPFSNKKDANKEKFEKSFQFLKDRKDRNETLAIITDKDGKKYSCVADRPGYYFKNPYFLISVLDENLKQVCYLSYYKVKDKLFLSSISTDENLRGKGLASKTLSLSNYFLQDIAGTMTFGNFKPFESTMVPHSEHKYTKEELTMAAAKFYESQNYNFVSLEEFSSSPEDYPYLEPEDFTLGEPSGILITKQIEKQKSYPFDIKDGVVIESTKENNSEPNS